MIKQRLTRTDWETINGALAMYQADDLESEASVAGVTIDELLRRVRAAREKVWDRIPINEV